MNARGIYGKHKAKIKSRDNLRVAQTSHTITPRGVYNARLNEMGTAHWQETPFTKSARRATAMTVTENNSVDMTRSNPPFIISTRNITSTSDPQRCYTTGFSSGDCAMADRQDSAQRVRSQHPRPTSSYDFVCRATIILSTRNERLSS
jgi:hypothetical protein